MCLVDGYPENALKKIEFELVSDCRRHRQNRVRLRGKSVETSADRLAHAARNFKRAIRRSDGADNALRYEVAYDSIHKKRIPISSGAKFRDQGLVGRSPRSEPDKLCNLGLV